jgi:uncharacterized membrane protein YfcA
VLLVLLAALPIGVLVGMVGIGGLLLPALLAQATGDAHGAAATSSWAFLFTGLVAAVVLARSGTLPRRLALLLALGAAPGAVLGALVNGTVPDVVLVVILAAITLGSGVQNLWPTRRSAGIRTQLPAAPAVGVGLAVGFGSALTGTGGPVLLVPALLLLDVALLETIALGLFVQLPIVSFATVGYLASGDVDLGWGTAFGVVAALGMLGGMALARRTRPEGLRRFAACVLVLTGAYLAGTVVLS